MEDALYAALSKPKILVSVRPIKGHLTFFCVTILKQQFFSIFLSKG
ncbi:hypothetical protein [Salinimonas iocasae]|nr:hypothetical protein [Salinimonas iocasae]